MGLNGLDTALSGLRVAQQQLNTIAGNISNVNTPGYTRKILPQETVSIEGTAVGVRSNPILRKVDLNLERDLWTQISSVTFLDVQASYMEKIQQFHGPPELELSIAAELAALRDAFSTLADSPEDTFLQRATVDQAKLLARKMNDFSTLISDMRNDTQDEISVAVNEVNSLLVTIADLNKQIRLNTAVGKTTAAMEDSRDEAIKQLATRMEVSFFVRGDNVLVVQTAEGVQLADERAETLFFEKGALGPASFYPDSATAIYVGGDPDDNPNAIDITDTGLNGKIGSLLDLRDDLLPRQQAMLDELAHKLALRFDAQGLRLFTDASGNIPADTPPDPLAGPPALAVEYVGFSAAIQVNQAIIADNELIRDGTVPVDLGVQTGSNEVIQRIIEFTFGDINFQQAAGTRDLRASGGPTTLQDWLGIFSENRVTASTALSTYSDINALLAAGGEVYDPDPPGPPLNDTFNLIFEEARTGLGPTTVSVSLSAAQTNFPIGGPIVDALDQLVAEINSQIALAGVPAGLAAVASRGPYGQLVIESRGNITIDNAFIGAMTEDGLDFIGLETGTFVTADPYVDVQVGNDPPIRITIEPGDDETDLVNKLNKINAGDPGVPGLGVDLDALTGFLTLRPGDSVTNPVFGGDLKIIGGTFAADGTGLAGGIAAGTGIVEALFGSANPITDVGYSSLTANPFVSVSFRSNNLGPGANLSTGIISSTTLIDFAQKMVNRQVEESNSIAAQNRDETAFRDLLQRRLLDESAVNLDEELSNLIVIQTAFAAAARVVTAIDEQFQELLRAI